METNNKGEKQPEPLDLDTVPNFTALGDWIGELEKWCEGARVRIESLEGDLSEAERETEELKHEMEMATDEASEALRVLVLFLLDVDRGIRTMEELRDFVERNNYERFLKRGLAA